MHQNKKIIIRSVLMFMKRALDLSARPFVWLYRLDSVGKFTAVLCAIGVFQVYAFIQSERAFVYPTAAEFSPPLVVPGPAFQGINIEMKNAGKSVAETDFIYAVITHELSPSPQYGIGASGQQQILAFGPLPGGTSRHRIFRFETGWGDSTTNGMKNGSIRLYLYGFITCRDGFSYFGPKQHGFCFVYVPSRSGFETCSERAYTYTH